MSRGVIWLALAFFSMLAWADPDPTEELDRVERLLQSAHSAAETRENLLADALALIQAGLGAAESPRIAARWREKLWLYHLLRSDHASAMVALEATKAELDRVDYSRSELARFYTDYSYSLIILGRIDEARIWLRKGIVLVQDAEPDILSTLYLSIADAYEKSGQVDVSRRYFELAYEMNRDGANDLYAFSAQMKLGNLDRQSGDITRAIERHNLALAFYDREHLYRSLVATIELGRDFLAAGRLQEALEYARRAVADKRAQEEQAIDAGILLLEVLAEIDAGEVDEAEASNTLATVESLLASTRERQQSTTTRPLRQLAFAGAAIRFYHARGDLEKVVLHGDHAIALTGTISEKLLFIADDHFAWLARVQPVFARYIHALYDLAPLEIVPALNAYQQYVEGSRILWGEGDRHLLTEKQALTVSRLDAYLSAEQALLISGNEIDSTGRIALERLRDVARDEYLVAKGEGAVRKRTVTHRHLELTEIPASDMVLQYYLDESLAFVAAVTASGVRIHALPPRTVIRNLVGTVLEKLSTSGESTAGTAALTDLAVLLPPEVRRGGLSASRLVVVPNDVIHHVPLSAINLAGPDEPFHPLTLDVEVIRTTSAPGYYHRDMFVRDNVPRLVVFADPIVGAADVSRTKWTGELGRLPYSAQEAASIKNTFQNANVSLFLGEAATGEALQSESARTANILHIATHGYYNELTPDIVGIATSAVNGSNVAAFLSLSELLNQQYKSNLVVVSGCSTMRGQRYEGVGVKSLSQGLLASGAGAVIGTLWPVPDRSTAVFMSAFYKHLEVSNGNAPRALRAARASLLGQHRFRNPTYWAGFVLHAASGDKATNVLASFDVTLADIK